MYIFDNILLKNTGHLNLFYSQLFFPTDARQDSLLSGVFNEASSTSQDNTPKKSTKGCRFSCRDPYLLSLCRPCMAP